MAFIYYPPVFFFERACPYPSRVCAEEALACTQALSFLIKIVRYGGLVGGEVGSAWSVLEPNWHLFLISLFPCLSHIHQHQLYPLHSSTGFTWVFESLVVTALDWNCQVIFNHRFIVRSKIYLFYIPHPQNWHFWNAPSSYSSSWL